jgi:hypothetical protein
MNHDDDIPGSSHFGQLLQAAAKQPQPQRLLFVFAGAELPPDATPQQRASFERGEGGTLAPLSCVDKTPDELTSFEALVEEARRYSLPWQVLFVAALGGAGGQPPTDAQVDQALQRMVDAVKHGRVGGFAAYDPAGRSLSFV